MCIRDSNKYYDTLSFVNQIYQKHLDGLTNIVTMSGHKDWNRFTNEEKKVTENTVLLVGLLYSMCKVELVLKGKKEGAVSYTHLDVYKRQEQDVMEHYLRWVLIQSILRHIFIFRFKKSLQEKYLQPVRLF